MRVGLFHQMWALAEKSDRDCIKEALSDVILADELGFESFWFGEHHNNRERAFFGRVPIPELVIARFAAETQRIRLGTGVKILPFDDAARFAESMALLDILTDGRAHYGVGMAVRAADTPNHERGPKFRQQLTDLLGYLRGETRDDQPALTPAPEQDLTGLLWIAASEDITVEHAARLGLNFVVGQAEHGKQQRKYVDTYRNAGGKAEVRGARMVYVGETERKRRRRRRPRLHLVQHHAQQPVLQAGGPGRPRAGDRARGASTTSAAASSTSWAHRRRWRTGCGATSEKPASTASTS